MKLNREWIGRLKMGILNLGIFGLLAALVVSGIAAAIAWQIGSPILKSIIDVLEITALLLFITALIAFLGSINSKE